jgi:dolichyl-diphosphooligosaccharide--protein glycosyltransferase
MAAAMKRRAVFWLGLALAAVVGAWLRLGTREQLAQDGRVRPMTSDDAYHLRRARFAVAHFPRTILFDPLMNFPQGGVPIWPPLYDVALALPARALDGREAPAGAVERRAAWVPLAFGLGAVVLAGLAARRLYGEGAGAAAAIFLAVCPGHLLWTQYGHTDQHAAESFFGLLVLLAFLASRDRDDSPEVWRSEVGAGLALGLAVLAWQGAIAWGAVIALSLFLEAVLTRRPIFRAAVLTLSLGAAVAALGTAFWLGGRRTPFTYISFGWFQPSFLAALAAGTVLLETLLRSARRELDRAGAVRRLAFTTVIVAALLPLASPLVAGFLRGVSYSAGVTPQEVMGEGGYLAYPKGWLTTIFEAQPLLSGGLGPVVKQLSVAFLLAPVVLAGWAWRAFRRERPATHILLAVWGSVTLFLSLSQKLNVYYAAVLAAFCFLEAVRWVLKSVQSAAPDKPTLAPAAAVLCASLLLSPMLPGIQQELSAVHVGGSELYAALDWMDKQLPRAVEPYDPRLLESPPVVPELSRAASVLAPWSLGHLVLYEAGQPVVANNFGYGFTDNLRFFLADSEDEALRIAAARRARWVMAADLLPRINDYARILGQPPFLTPQAGGLAPTPAYFRTLQARLYDFEGAVAEFPGGVRIEPLAHFRLLYRSKTGVRRGDRLVAQWKVFEIVP